MVGPIRTKVREILASLEKVEASAVIRKDGLLIASSFPEGTDKKSIGALSAKMVNTAEACSGEIGRGDLRQIILETEKGKIISISAGKDVFLLCVVGGEAPLGPLLLSLSSAADEMKKIFG